MGFFDNTREPIKLGGKLMVKLMNYGHSDMSKWGLSHLRMAKGAKVIDIGCGGGANIDRLLKLCPDGEIIGIDYSKVSVESSIKRNRRCVKRGQCHIIEGNVSDLPFKDESFDAATAFETIYFWPNIVDSFKEVFRTLKCGGKFLICNEFNGEGLIEKRWEKKISGMKIYKAEDIEEQLKQAGFSNIEIKRRAKNNTICVIGQKCC